MEFTDVDGIGELGTQATPITIISGIFLTKPDVSFATVSAALLEANWKTNIANGDILPVLNVRSRENMDTEDAVIDTDGGDKVFQFEGTRGLLLKFILPLDLHKILKDQYSFKNWRMFIVDKNGNVIGTSPDGTKVQGRKLSYFRVKKQETPSADTAAYTPIELQFADIKEYDEKAVYFNPTWLATDLTGVLKVTLTPGTITTNVFTATVAWVSTSEIDKATSAFKTFAIPGLVAANFRIIDQTGALLDNASDYTVTESTATPGTYTIDATVGTITSGTCQVVATSTALYKSDIETVASA